MSGTHRVYESIWSIKNQVMRNNAPDKTVTKIPDLAEKTGFKSKAGLKKKVTFFSFLASLQRFERVLSLLPRRSQAQLGAPRRPPGIHTHEGLFLLPNSEAELP